MGFGKRNRAPGSSRQQGCHQQASTYGETHMKCTHDLAPHQAKDRLRGNIVAVGWVPREPLPKTSQNSDKHAMAKLANTAAVAIPPLVDRPRGQWWSEHRGLGFTVIGLDRDLLAAADLEHVADLPLAHALALGRGVDTRTEDALVQGLR